MASANIADHIFLAITIDIGILDLFRMTDTEVVSLSYPTCEHVTLAVEEDSMMLAVIVATDDIHSTVSIEVGVVDDIIAVTEFFFEVSHVDEVTVSNTVLGPVRAAAWVVAYHVSLLVAVHVNPLEVTTLAVIVVKQHV
jgi:hypothetical protein